MHCPLSLHTLTPPCSPTAPFPLLPQPTSLEQQWATPTAVSRPSTLVGPCVLPLPSDPSCPCRVIAHACFHQVWGNNPTSKRNLSVSSATSLTDQSSSTARSESWTSSRPTSGVWEDESTSPAKKDNAPLVRLTSCLVPVTPTIADALQDASILHARQNPSTLSVGRMVRVLTSKLNLSF